MTSRRRPAWPAAIAAGMFLAPLIGCGPAAQGDAAPVGATAGVTASPATTGAAPADARQLLARAAAYLWSRQADDGGWHSEIYTLLRPGEALTPMILVALLEVPESVAPRPEGGVERALQFLRRAIDARGALGLTDPELLEYPNYGTALALRCLLAADRPEDGPRIARLRDYLLREQFTPDRGFPASHAAHGAWGFGGPQPSGLTGHMDLAHTRRVLEALQEAGGAGEALSRAEHFLRYVQRHPDDPRPQPRPNGVERDDLGRGPYDGGFYFSPIVLGANKAGYATSPEAIWYRSYATATCDGLLALLAAGVDRDDPRMLAARRWLAAHPRLDYPQGIPPEGDEPWGPALFYYHQAVRAEVYDAIGWPEGARDEMTRLLADRAADDGSCANRDSGLQKEDDPLLATSQTVLALVRVAR